MRMDSGRAVATGAGAGAGARAGAGATGAGSVIAGSRRRLVAGRRGGAAGTATATVGADSGGVMGGAGSPLVGLSRSPATTSSTAPEMRTTSRMESTTGTTAGGSVPTADPPPDRVQPRTIVAVLAIGFVGVFLYVAFNVQLPYYAFAPGSAIDTSRLVVVDEDRDHPPEGRILLTTVSLGKVSLLEAIEGWLDPGIDVVEERLVTPPEIDEDEFRELNLQAMDDSKQKAIGVAFEALGVDAITGAGAEVVQIEPETPADGLLAVGDTIVAVDDAEVALDADAIVAIGGHTPGDTVTLRVRPADAAAGDLREVQVTLAARPDDASRAFLGVSLTTKDLAYDFPFEVDLQSEQIGGPSAGLAFTLAVIDRLTEGELTGGEVVATTGTIELDGHVGEVGGVAQKTIAVRRSGATLFLVPPGELELARKFAGDDLRVVPVATLDDALAALAEVGGNALALPNLGSEGAS